MIAISATALVVVALAAAPHALMSRAASDAAGIPGASTMLIPPGHEAASLRVRNMWCAGCLNIVYYALDSVRGVTAVEVWRGAAAVVYDPSETDIPTLIAATANNGYPSKVMVE